MSALNIEELFRLDDKEIIDFFLMRATELRKETNQQIQEYNQLTLNKRPLLPEIILNQALSYEDQKNILIESMRQANEEAKFVSDALFKKEEEALALKKQQLEIQHSAAKQALELEKETHEIQRQVIQKKHQEEMHNLDVKHKSELDEIKRETAERIATILKEATTATSEERDECIPPSPHQASKNTQRSEIQNPGFFITALSASSVISGLLIISGSAMIVSALVLTGGVSIFGVALGIAGLSTYAISKCGLFNNNKPNSTSSYNDPQNLDQPEFNL